MSTHIRLGMLPVSLITRRPVSVPTGAWQMSQSTGGGASWGPSTTIDPTAQPPAPVDPGSIVTNPAPLPPVQIPPTPGPSNTGIVPPMLPPSVFAPPDASPPVAPGGGAIVGLSSTGKAMVIGLGILGGVILFGALAKHHHEAA